MQIKDNGVIDQIKRMVDHYTNNISTRHVRPVLIQLNIEKPVWDSVERFMGSMNSYQVQNLQLDELYRQIAAIMCLIDEMRRDLVPIIRSKLIDVAPSERVLRDMTVNNFPSNVEIFAERTKELYRMLIELDLAYTKEKRLKKPLYTQIVELEYVENFK